MAIISASFRTDIPAFHADWLMQQLRQGFCQVELPYNKRVVQVDLTPQQVDGLVLWTKNAAPLLPYLDEIKGMGLPFMFQISITGYSTALPALEPRVPPAATCIESIHHLAQKYGPHTAVWRYDPIIATSETPGSFHLANFESLARQMTGAVNEVVISFCQTYPKTVRGLDAAAQKQGFRWRDPSAEKKRQMGAKLAAIAAAHGMKLSLCSQEDLLAPGVQPASCVDAQRLSTIGGKDIQAQLKGNRPTCRCYKSIDIGTYNTCGHGCPYCYATANHEQAQAMLEDLKKSAQHMATIRCKECSMSKSFDINRQDPPITSTGACKTCGGSNWSVIDNETKERLI